MPAVDDLLERMRRSKGGWSADDLEKLYIGLGFESREGAKHRVYIHARFPELRATVTRSRSLATFSISGQRIYRPRTAYRQKA